MQISSTGSNSWFEQVGLFATAPVYCSLARGSLNGAAAGTTAYSCHLRFTPGTASPDWDIVAFAGAPGGGGGGGPEPVGAWTIEGNPTGTTTTPTAFTIGSLTAKTTPASTDQLLLQDNAASGALKSVPWSSLPSGGGGGGMSIGGAITGGTAGEVLMVGTGSVLAQTTNLPVSVLNSGISADTAHFWRGDGTWASALVATPYTPVNLGTALRAWYKMDLLTGSAGSSQATIPDQSGNGFNLSQSTGSQQGTLAVADQNGLNTLRLTQVNSQNYQLALSILSGATAGSLYMVYKVVSTTADNRMLGWGASGVSTWPYVSGDLYNNFGAPGQYLCGIPTGALLSAGYRIFSVYSDTNDWSLYVDGGTGGSSGGISPLHHETANTVSWTSTAPYLGADNAFSTFTDGWVAELYFTNAHQTTSDRQRNEGYLAHKWGLTGNLSPSHPYKSVAPTLPLPPTTSIGGAVDGGTNLSALFINPVGILAQDNPNFTYDPATKYLSVGVTGGTGRYYVNGQPAIYQVPNGSGDNWFEGNSGNGTLTGYRNYATGDNAMANVTTGTKNFAIGSYALNALTTGDQNVAVGDGGLLSITTASNNVSLGQAALLGLIDGNQNVGIGFAALQALTTTGGNSDQNVAVGSFAGNVASSSIHSVFIGASCAVSLTSSTSDVFVGRASGYSLTGTTSGNVYVGDAAGLNITAGSNTTIVGRWLGPSAAVSNVIGFASGTNLLQDWNYIHANAWSFQRLGTAQGLHVYNTLDNPDGPTNWERGLLDWNATANTFRLASQAGGTGTVRLIAVDGFQKAGAPAAGDLPSGTFALINDTSGGQTWLAYNAAGTIRKVQLV
jgi:hypothetical protein